MKRILISESQLKYITETFNQTDILEIERIVRKEIKDAMSNSKFKSKVKDILTDEYKSKDFEKRVVDVSKNVLVQLYKQLYNKRSFWTSGLSNDPN